VEFAYPLRCQPFFQDYLWGGRKLETRLGKPIPENGVWAESWEIMDHPHHQSQVINGSKAGMTLREIISQQPEWLLGTRLHQAGVGSLPLLLKYLDCQKVLSIQVHPDDGYASKMSPPDLGKTEAWYVVDAEPGAVVYAGLKPGVTPAELQLAISSGTLESHLHTIRPRSGDCIFIPAGTIHALGAGLLVAEIQQASNTTFRLYDWNRRGPDGQLRPLHVERAVEVADFQTGPRRLQKPVPTEQPGRTRLVACEKFCLDQLSGPPTTDLRALNSTNSPTACIDIAGDESFHILTTPTGGIGIAGQAFSESLSRGQSVLLPAAIGSCRALLNPGAILLDMFVPTVD